MNAAEGVLRYLGAACGPVAPLFPALGHDVCRLIWAGMDIPDLCRMRRVCTTWFVYVHATWRFKLTRLDHGPPSWHIFPPVANAWLWVPLILRYLPPAVHAELLFLERTLDIRGDPPTAAPVASARRSLDLWRSRDFPAAKVNRMRKRWESALAERLAAHTLAVRQHERWVAVQAACQTQRVRVWEWALERYVPDEMSAERVDVEPSLKRHRK
jgi:hypothetical protein